MSRRTIQYKGFSVSVADGWDDITATLNDCDAPLTVAEPSSGVGALQFSAAIYRGGLAPQVGQRELSELLRDFATKQGFGAAFDQVTYPGEVTIEGASFHVGNDFIRAWYVSDSNNIVLANYVCE